MILLLAALAVSTMARATGEVTIYRCIGSGGKLSLQDHPCPKDARQDVRQMLRPTDPPPRPQLPVAAAQPASAQTEIRIVHVRDPQPLYECRSFDGQTYLNQTGIPEQRFVPLWALGYRRFGEGFNDIGRPAPVPLPQPAGQPANNQFADAGTWIADRCVRLPQAEVCQRLRDRQDELGTRIFNAQPSDRARYERERQGLTEQLHSDCGAN